MLKNNIKKQKTLFLIEPTSKNQVHNSEVKETKVKNKSFFYFCIKQFIFFN